ncbi:hypothetical protein [Nocardia sp. NPDC050406]
MHPEHTRERQPARRGNQRALRGDSGMTLFGPAIGRLAERV